MSNSKYGLHGSLKASSGNGTALANILLRAAKLVSTAPGCLLYLISLDESQPDTVWITEAWENQHSHDESLKNPEVRALIGEAMPLLDGTPLPGQKLEILGGHGI